MSAVREAAHTMAKVVDKNPLNIGSTKAGGDYTWEQLETIEKKRRKILTRTEDPFWKILTNFDGTVLKFLLKDTLIWFTLLLYVLVRIQSRLTVPKQIGDLANTNTTVLGGFLSFFLVFYVNQSNKRYFDLYNTSMGCKGRIFDVATLAATYLDPEVATRLVRYMNAAHVAGYVGLSKTYPSSSFFAKLNHDLGLLNDREMKRMNTIDLDKGGASNRELITWCLREIHILHKSGEIDNELAQQFREEILQLRASIGQLYNAADLPIPFFYVHFICLLSSLYLPLFAISQAYRAGTGNEVYWTADVVAGLVVLLQAIFVQGLRVLGQQLSDPYGDDQVDLSVIFFCVYTWRQSNRVLNTEFPNTEESPSEETMIEQRTASLGDAWELPKILGDEEAAAPKDNNAPDRSTSSIDIFQCEQLEAGDQRKIH